MKKVIAVFLSLVMLAALAASAGADPVFLHPFTRVDDSALYLAGASSLRPRRAMLLCSISRKLPSPWDWSSRFRLCSHGLFISRLTPFTLLIL